MVKTHLSGKEGLVNLLIVSIQKICKASSQITSMSSYDEVIINFLAQVDYLLEIMTPLLVSQNVDLVITGNFDQHSVETEGICIQLNNLFQTIYADKKLDFRIGLNSCFTISREFPSQWCLEMIVNTPDENLNKISQWIQANYLDQLATYLGAPSISYYGKYSSDYFIQALNLLLISLGEPQADGTLRISMSNNKDDSLKIGDIDPSELSLLLLDKIKKLVGGWF
jgi:hypothetical protein